MRSTSSQVGQFCSITLPVGVRLPVCVLCYEGQQVWFQRRIAEGTFFRIKFKDCDTLSKIRRAYPSKTTDGVTSNIRERFLGGCRGFTQTFTRVTHRTAVVGLTRSVQEKKIFGVADFAGIAAAAANCKLQLQSAAEPTSMVQGLRRATKVGVFIAAVFSVWHFSFGLSQRHAIAQQNATHQQHRPLQTPQTESSVQRWRGNNYVASNGIFPYTLCATSTVPSNIQRTVLNYSSFPPWSPRDPALEPLDDVLLLAASVYGETTTMGRYMLL